MPKGSIRRRPDRGPTAWQARWYVGRDERGRQRSLTRSFDATTKREAERMSTKILAELEAQADVEQSERGTVAEYARKWLRRKERELSPTTIQFGYQTIVKRIIERFGRMQLADVQPEHVREWYGELADMGLSGRTVERHHQVLRRMFREAREDRKVVDLPTSFSRPKVPKAKTTTPTPEQVRLAIDTAEGELRRALILLASTGMRRGELFGLRWQDVKKRDDGGQMVVVRNAAIALARSGGKVGIKGTKTDEPRTVLVYGEPVAALLEQWDETAARLKRSPNPDDFVFPSLEKAAEPRHPDWLTYRWSLLRSRIGMDAIRLHDFRHFHATYLLAQGIPVGDVSRRLGHSLVSTTLDIYSHSTPAAEIEAAKAARFDV